MNAELAERLRFATTNEITVEWIAHLRRAIANQFFVSFLGERELANLLLATYQNAESFAKLAAIEDAAGRVEAAELFAALAITNYEAISPWVRVVGEPAIAKAG